METYPKFFTPKLLKWYPQKLEKVPPFQLLGATLILKKNEKKNEKAPQIN
jgi:hypothetical protein